MSFATSLLALSLHSLAAQPEKSAHSGTEAAYCNFFTAMGATIRQDVKIPSANGVWRPDMVVDFGDFQVIVEVKTHKTSSGMGFVQTTNGCEYSSIASPVKQALAYFTKGETMWTKPTICMAVSNMEFVAFNPIKFTNRKEFIKCITKQPSMYDAPANDWIKSKRAFKALKTQSVSAFNKITPDEFKNMMREVAGLPEVEPLRMIVE